MKFEPALAASALVLTLSATLSAQLSPVFASSFVDPLIGSGTIGVTQDEVTLDYFVTAYQSSQNVHRFDVTGASLTNFSAAGCTPALTSPNDITYDPTTETLWLVDNSGDKVLQMDRQGNCLGGWTTPTPLSNPVGICVDRTSGTLYISHTGAVLECDKFGNQLTGGFAFTPVSGSTILSGITHVPATDRFLLTQSGGSDIFEVDRAGTLISTTSMTSFGIGNTQGLHYNPVSQQLMVIDNSLSTTFVFDLPFCNGSLVQKGLGCPDGSGTMVWLGASGCANVGNAVVLSSFAGPNPLPMLFAGGVSSTSVGGLPLPLDMGPLGAPGCLIYTSSEAVVGAPQAGNKATLLFPIPNTPGLTGAQLFFQAISFDLTLSSPLQLATSNYVAMVIV